MRRLGSRVTIIQQGSRLLEREDEDVSNAIQELMRDEEIEVFVNSEIVMFRGSLETE
jgi:pyruvate/2-oxoglutarate dehydrogenase complex dihydrolipoamide dehydrogenase (E3) component